MNKSRNTIEPYSWGDQCLGWKHFAAEGLAVIEEEMPPGTSEIWHFHRVAQQVFFVLSGQLRFEIEMDSALVQSQESVAIAAGRLHRVWNDAGETAKFLAISSPATAADRIDIIPYNTQYASAFQTLNEEWLNKYFWVEDWDREILSDPEKQILSKGGKIFFAREKNEIIGTVALMPDEKGLVELSKMAVRSDQQGKGTGRQLLKFAILESQKMGLEGIHLYSNRKLASAIHLYRSFGFEEIPVGASHYQRADIKMELRFTHKTNKTT